jgi:hypothetical protein
MSNSFKSLRTFIIILLLWWLKQTGATHSLQYVAP